MSVAARDLVSKLCCPQVCYHAWTAKEQAVRLGRDGVAELKQHPFFTGLDWSRLREQRPPFVPDLASSMDTVYIPKKA